MKKTILLPCMLFGILAYSQVGINNTSPKGTLDVVSGTNDGTKAEGVMFPRITGNVLKTADTNGVYALAQDGILVYVTAAPDPANRTGQVEGMDKPGFYYFNAGANRWLGIEMGNGSNGHVDALQCLSATNYGILENAEPAAGVVTVIPYTGGNGGVYSAQTIPSSGVLGLTASLQSGTFNSGSGTLIFTITGTPDSTGDATFDVTIGGSTCSIIRTVGSGSSIPVSVLINIGNAVDPIYKKMMTNNLGGDGIDAGTTTVEKKHHGNYYQWGRKDPVANADTSNAVIGGWNTAAAANQSWNSGTPSDPVKTIADPCPDGFRVPTRSEWVGLLNNSITSNIGSWITGDCCTYINFTAGKKLVNNGNTIILPAAGYREVNVGSLYNRASHADYWASTEEGSNVAQSVYADSYQFNVNSWAVRSYGYSVRCISEATY